MLVMTGLRELSLRVVMRDVGTICEDTTVERPTRCTEGLAFEVIHRLIASRKSGALRVLDHLVDQLASAACGPDPALAGAVEQLRQAHVTDFALVCDYIPEAARRLGEGWQDDTRSFMDVTMGVARLTDLLREVGGEWKGDDAEVAGRPSVLLIVPHGEQHTLGASVLACRMRHLGVSVCLRIGPALSDLATLVATRGFVGAMVTLSHREKAESCAVLVRALRTLGKGGLPVALGGAAVEDTPNLMDLTGADLVTNVLEEALAHFNVKAEQKT
jgi:methylmalonyl-CoA mutase cobalamin-binding subunit